MPIKDQNLKAIEFCNNCYHSTTKASPLEIKKEKLSKKKCAIELLIKNKSL